MHIFDYIDEEENQYEVTFDYDPDLFGEEEPSQSPWNYITIEQVVDSNGVACSFDDDKLSEIAEYLWKTYKYEF